MNEVVKLICCRGLSGPVPVAGSKSERVKGNLSPGEKMSSPDGMLNAIDSEPDDVSSMS